MQVEKVILNEKREVSLTCYIQQVEGEFGLKRRPAIIVLPGGGYGMCSDREADPVAFAYLKAGYHVFILRYTVGEHGKWPDQLNDYEMAFEMITERADEWTVEKNCIAVVGFSAGGHLAACAATIAKNKPAATVLIYPAIIKELCDLMCQPGLPYPNEHVDVMTAPCFIAQARDDSIGIKNTLAYGMALAENGVPFESHIYSYGGHAFSTAECWLNIGPVSERIPNWVDDSIGWLKETLGELTWKGMTEPNPGVRRSGNAADVLSVSCTLSHILTQNEEVQTILEPLYERLRPVCQEKGCTIEELGATMGQSKINEFMVLLQFSEDEVNKMDQRLHQCKNERHTIK